MPSRSISDVLQQPGSTEHRLLQKARQLQRMQSQLLGLLSPELLPHVQIANLRGQTLVLTTDGNAWASRLRYLSADLLRQLQAAGWPCQRLDIKVASSFAASPAQTKRRSISASARRLLQQTARHIDDPELAAALEKLAQHKQPLD